MSGRRGCRGRTYHFVKPFKRQGGEEKEGKGKAEGRACVCVCVCVCVDPGDLSLFEFDPRARATSREDAVEGSERRKFMEGLSRGGDRGWDEEYGWRNSY